MARYDWWNVKMPEGPQAEATAFSTREQVWARFAFLVSELKKGLDQSLVERHDGKPKDTFAALGHIEGPMLAREVRRLDDVVGSLSEDVIEALAKLAPKHDTETTPLVDSVMDDFNGDIRKFVYEQPDHEGVALAIRILQANDYDGDTLQTVLKALAGHDEDDYERTRRYCKKGEKPKDRGKVFPCPRCDGDGEVRTASGHRTQCRRCRGYAFVFQAGRPDDAEYDMSPDGKTALNAGQSWTTEDEARVRAEEDAA